MKHRLSSGFKILFPETYSLTHTSVPSFLFSYNFLMFSIIMDMRYLSLRCTAAIGHQCGSGSAVTGLVTRSPCVAIAILVTFLLVHYIPVTYCLTGSLHLFQPSLPLPLSVWQPSVCSLFYFEFVSVLSVHLFSPVDSTYKWKNKVFVFLCLTCLT